MCKEDVVKQICTECSKDDSIVYGSSCDCDKAENITDTVEDYKYEKHGGAESLADD